MCKDENHHRDCGCGCVGPQGPQGIPGLQGVQGVPGVAGADGKPGPMGPQGFQGIPGPVGQPGMQGPQGVPGPMGQQGAQGQQGPAGSQGLQGPAGNDGENGLPGVQGPLGPMGPQGPQGIQGVPGKDCDCDHDVRCDYYANVYANPPQLLQPFGVAGDTVLFQGQNAVSAGDFDLSLVSIDGSVKFLKDGVYYISWGAEAKVEPPIPFPTPSFSFGLWLNGNIIPGATLSGYTQAPNDDTLHIAGDVIVAVKANDVLKLRNASSLVVNMNPNTVGIQFPVTVASLVITCVK